MITKKNIVISISIVIIVAIAVVAVLQMNKLRIAHSSFEHYYAFRGCTKLIAKTDTSGVCMTGDGQIIGIQEYGDKWYLEGEGPGQW